MTRGSVLEYAGAIRDRYFRANKKEKKKILDEFVQVTGYHRKGAIRLLRRPAAKAGTEGRGRPSVYKDVIEPLKAIWEASDRLCSKRLHPFVPEMVKVLRQKDEQRINAAVEAKLCRMSQATIDRLLKPYRKVGGRKTPSTTRPGNLLKNAIAIKTFGDWRDNDPGFVEVDLVAHCGESSEGFYLNTLCAVDVASGWLECLPVWGKGQDRVRAAIHRMRQRLPFRLRGVDSDNGGEFINQGLFTYCKEEKITFTRSRPYKKNDSCHVEQKNGNVIRRLVGYDRYTTRPALQALERLYANVRLYVNFFQPTLKLRSKTRHGAKVHKVYETARTPYQRLQGLEILTKTQRVELAAVYAGLNPVRLLKEINSQLEQLWKMAEHPNDYR